MNGLQQVPISHSTDSSNWIIVAEICSMMLTTLLCLLHRLPVVNDRSNDCPGQTARVTSNLHSSSSTMAVSRVPSPPLPEVNTPVAENWCYTQVSSRSFSSLNRDLTTLRLRGSMKLHSLARHVQGNSLRDFFLAFVVLKDEWHESPWASRLTEQLFLPPQSNIACDLGFVFETGTKTFAVEKYANVTLEVNIFKNFDSCRSSATVGAAVHSPRFVSCSALRMFSLAIHTNHLLSQETRVHEKDGEDEERS